MYYYVRESKYIDREGLMTLTGATKSRAEKIIRELNKELADEGYITIKGKAPIKYVMQRLGLDIEDQENKIAMPEV